jgi:hypothetical protein
MHNTPFGLRIVTENGEDSVKDDVLYFLIAYYRGSVTQIHRYLRAIKELENGKDFSFPRLLDCLHEISSLFENLFAMYKYFEKIGIEHESHQIWKDVRHHVRHDFREQIDENDKRTIRRAKKLQLKPNMLTNLEFGSKVIKIGNMIIEISDINEYLRWARSAISPLIKEARSDN